MAQVWAARLHGTRGFRKLVALKTILPSAQANPRMNEMFIAEATLASQVHHPNVVETLELGEDDGLLYLAMEWIDGESLSRVMKHAANLGGVPLPIAVNLIGQACKGLHAAHELCDDMGRPINLVHRDVSPQNILVSYAGNAKLVDFGIAKASGRTSLTEVGEVKGKFAYMSPEQISGRALDRRSDLFSMSVVLYWLSTGQHPFRGESPADTVRRICDPEPPQAPRAIDPHYPAELEAVIMKGLSKSPDDRYATAMELVVALEHALPHALDSSFYSEVSAYMQQLLGDHAKKRRAQIRIAEGIADRCRSESGFPSSHGSLRGLAIDPAPQSEPAPSAPLANESAPISTLSGQINFAPNYRRKLALLSLTAVVGSAIAIVSANWSSPPATSRGVPASAPLTTLSVSALAPSPVPIPPPSAAPAVDSSVEVAPFPGPDAGQAKAKPAAIKAAKRTPANAKPAVTAGPTAATRPAGSAPSIENMLGKRF
jgi:serine/threonine-protein kinase